MYKHTEPKDVSYILWSSLITVLLPQPDSPTRATVEQLLIDKLKPVRTLNTISV